MTTTAALRSRYRVLDADEIRPGDILGPGRVRVTGATVTAEGRVDLSLANGQTRRFPAHTTIGVYR
jgi:hypothetical protein